MTMQQTQSDTPRYKLEKVGDSYVPVKQGSPASDAELATWCAAGGVIALYGLLRRGLLGPVLLGAGGLMIYRGVTGRNPLGRFLCGSNRALSGDDSLSPSFPREEESSGAGQLPADEVDEAAMESFPASDPPSRTATTSL